MNTRRHRHGVRRLRLNKTTGAIAAVTVALSLPALSLSACVARPGPPPLAEEAPKAPGIDGAPESSATTTPAEKPDPAERSTISVGIDELHDGLNPHLAANSSPVVDEIAALVLPSAFVDGELNKDLLLSAQELPVEQRPADTNGEEQDTSAPPSPAQGEATESTSATPTSAHDAPQVGTRGPKTAGKYVQRVRYEIAPAAQWSDGKPITAEDFKYLWQSMVTHSGVVDPAGYHAIGDIDSTASGRVVEVYFTHRVEDWQLLFDNLLPAHLLNNNPEAFGSDLANGIPASAGRYEVVLVDRARGVVELNRNDRYWGTNPAHIDVVRLITVRSTAQGVDLLRTKQIAFADVSPGETTQEAYELVPGVTTREHEPQRHLSLQLSQRSEILNDTFQRRRLIAALDMEKLARLTTGRSHNNDIPEAFNATAQAKLDRARISKLADSTEHRPLKIAADPADPLASSAVRTIVDMLAAHDVKAEVVSVGFDELTTKYVPQGLVDAVVSWKPAHVTSVSAASEFLCPNGSDVPWGSSFASVCPTDANETFKDMLAGKYSADEREAILQDFNNQHFYTVPIVAESRIHARSEGITDYVVPESSDATDKGGELVNVPAWRLRSP